MRERWWPHEAASCVWLWAAPRTTLPTASLASQHSDHKQHLKEKTMRRFTPHGLIWTVVLVAMPVARPHEVMAQQELRRLPATQIAIDEDILTAFADEPCRNFEAARDAFVRGENRQAAHNLRTASAFLRLEAARATADGKLAIDASVRELQRLAVAIDNNQVRAVEVLQQAFARAHYALAGHHCIKSAHRCCQPAAFENERSMNRIGHDLNAAATHLKRGALWAGSEPDTETLSALNTARFSAERLIRMGETQQDEVTRAIHSVRDNLEKFTGRKIMLAPPLVADDDLGPSIIR
jgi:hypothetical protein